MKITSIAMQNSPMAPMSKNNNSNKLADIVSQLNNKLQLKRNYDVTAFDSKLTALGKAHKDDETQADYKLTYEDSPMNGTRSVAEWAELSATNNRNGLESLSRELEYQKSLLSAAAERGDSSVTTDYTDVINNHLRVYTGFAEQYNNYSGGLASPILGDTMQGITAEGLGLTELSGSPEEIIAKLTAAQEQLAEAARSLEQSFASAAGKPMEPNDMPPINRDVWAGRMAADAPITVNLTSDMTMSGETLKMN